MLLKIRDKQGCVRALELNAAQMKFEADCGQRNIMLKAHMCWLVGQGNEGKMQELEQRIKRQEISVYRLGGVGAALGGVLTIVHLALDYLKVMHR
jgi:hypothetical protein